MAKQPEPQSEAERVAALPQAQYEKWFKRKAEKWFETHEYDWPFWQRFDQREPEGEWRTWLVMAGRGFGKTRMGAEWIRAQAEADGSLRIALVGASLGEVRSIMVEGESGLLNIAPDALRPDYSPSLHKLEWKNGAIANLYSAAEPESLRGPEHHIAWCDEIAKWEKAEATWDNLSMTLRLSNQPRVVATTTPRAVPLIRRLVKEYELKMGVAVTRGATSSNRLNLPGPWLAAMEGLYGGSRLGRQELQGELIEEVEDALWTRELLELCRVSAFPELRRVVIGVDPPASTGGDACGIVVVGLGGDGRGYVLADHSVDGKSPEGWARAVASAAARWDADKVIAEANNGGAMVESVLRAADVGMPVKLVHASRGKVARAEPVEALYRGGKVAHVGAFPVLEDELCGLITGGGYEGPGRSPDRADALVWAVTEVMLGKRGVVPRVRVL